MKTRLLAAFAVLSLMAGTVVLASPANAQTFVHADNNGDNR